MLPVCVRRFHAVSPAAMLLIGLAWASDSFAQVQTGRIIGTVRDPSTATVPNAAVLVTNVGTDQSVEVVTNERGDYVVTPLNPGVYQVTVSAEGFQAAVVDGVEVQVGQSLRVDVDLALGAVTESTTVTSDAPLLDTESGTLGHVVTNTQIVDLPLNGRSFYELARLTPGAAVLPGGGNLLRIRANFISGTAVSGVRGNQQTFMLDGVDVTDHHQGGTLIQTSIDALQEFKVQQSAYSAEFSQAGGMLNATTKAGSNELHGSLFEFIRDDSFDKTAFVVPDEFTYGDSGGAVLREDSFKTLDFSLFKQFRLGDSRLQFRAEAFNVTNTPSFNAPETDIDTAAGGRVTSTASTPRQLQFAVKYEC